MRPTIAAAFTATALILAVEPAHAWGHMGVATTRQTPVVVAPQQTFALPNNQAVIVPRPFPIPQRELFVPAGVAVPSAFVPFRTFHPRFGHVVVFVDPATSVVWPSGFWCWSGTAWAWVPQTIVW